MAEVLALNKGFTGQVTGVKKGLDAGPGATSKVEAVECQKEKLAGLTTDLSCELDKLLITGLINLQIIGGLYEATWGRYTKP